MKIKMISFAALVIFSLAGCEKTARDSTENYSLPPGLTDCKIFNLQSNMGSIITVMRCPLSSTTTTYPNGKTTSSVTLIEQNNMKKID